MKRQGSPMERSMELHKEMSRSTKNMELPRDMSAPITVLGSITTPTSTSTSAIPGQKQEPAIPGQKQEPAIPGQTQEQSLEAIPLIEYLAKDTRPTFILRRDTGQVAYRNPALERVLKAQNVQGHAFNAWAQTASENVSPSDITAPSNVSLNDTTVPDNVSLNDSSSYTSLPPNDSPLAQTPPSTLTPFAGFSWTATPLHETWTVISAASEIREKNDEKPLPTRTRAQSIRDPMKPQVRHGSIDADSEAHSKTRQPPTFTAMDLSNSWKTMSDSGSSGARAQRQFDWTRFYISGLSPHIQLVRQFDWASTPLGPMNEWSDGLRQAVIAMMMNTEPRVLLWGTERTMIYNESSAALFGQKHPLAMGAKAEEVWAESWKDLDPIVSRAQFDGKSTRISSMPLTMNRHGFAEETHWTLQMIPVLGPDGLVHGVLDEFAETTHAAVPERRREALVRINQSVSTVTNMKELWSEYLKALETCYDDVPFALLYTASAEHDTDTDDTSSNPYHPHTYLLEGSVGLPAGMSSDIPASLDLTACPSNNKTLASACRRILDSGEDVVLHAKHDTLPPELALAIPGRAHGERVKAVCILPVQSFSGTGKIVSFLVIAATPRRPYDGDAALFVHYLRDILTKSCSAIVLPEEQRRERQRFEKIETSLAQQLRATALEAEKIEARFAKMSEMAPVGMYAISASGETLFFNEAYLNITGITREEAMDSRKEPGDALHPEDRERVMQAWATCLETQQPFSLEYRVLKPWLHLDPATGDELTGESWVLASAEPEFDENGVISHVQGWLLDISDRKDHERLRIKRAHNEKAEARFARLAETAPLGMYLLHIDGKPIYLNDAYFDLLGFTRSDFEEAEARGVGWADRIEDEDREMVTAAWQKLIEGEPLNLEYRIKKPWKAYDTTTGTEMSGPTWLQGTAIAEMDEEGNFIAVQGFVTEISAKKFSERLLAERLENALETKQQADRFIDMVSHEMRNPLSAILQSADGVLTALESSGLPLLDEDVTISNDVIETILDSAQTIVLCAQHQKRIVDDILCLSKLDSNLLVICPDRVSPPALIEKTFKMYEAELTRSSVVASLVIEPSYSELEVEDVMLDSSRLLQVVINLFTNAIKFTQYADTREIRIRLGASTIRPVDETMFIAPRALRPDHTASSEWGNGEEIYIKIAVEDTGRGLTEEELKLLFQRFQQASPKTYKQYGGSGLGLFISRELSELQGGQIGVRSEAGQGSTFTFFIKARRYVSGGLHAPGDDGRKQTPTLQASPVMYGRAGSVTSLDSAHLEVVRTSTPNSTRAKAPAKGLAISSHSPSEPFHVLIVEDNLVNQRVMAQQLKRLGCVVHVANHGVEALEFLRTTTFWDHSMQMQAASLEPLLDTSAPVDPTSLIPLSVVLMDLEMPVLGGLGCIKQIRGLQRAGHLTGHVPVIAVTANARSEQIAIAIDHGMDSVVTKPFRIPELVPQMHSLVLRVRAEVNE